MIKYLENIGNELSNKKGLVQAAVELKRALREKCSLNSLFSVPEAARGTALAGFGFRLSQEHFLLQLYLLLSCPVPQRPLQAGCRLAASALFCRQRALVQRACSLRDCQRCEGNSVPLTARKAT